MIEKINKWLLIPTFLLVLAVLLVGGNNQSVSFGAAGSRFPNGISADSTSPVAGQVRGTYLASTGSLTVGSSGTAIARVNTGTCYIKAYATTIAATSSAEVDCQATAAVSASGIAPLTGITFGDAVSATLSTTTAGSVVGGLAITGVSASTTAGYISIRIVNLTGGTYTWPTTGSATGTATYIVTDL